MVKFCSHAAATASENRTAPTLSGARRRSGSLTNAFPDSRNIETLRRLGYEGWRRLGVCYATKVKSPMAAFENRPFFGVDRNRTCCQPICSPCHLLINARHTTELTFNPSGDRATHFHSPSGKNRPSAAARRLPKPATWTTVAIRNLPSG